MKHKLTKLFSLVLALTMLLTLAPSAFAADGDEGDGGSAADAPIISEVADIYVTPSANDGHLNFGTPNDLRYLSYEEQKETAPGTGVSLVSAMAKVCTDALPSATLDYVSYVSVSANQGTLYDGYVSEGDTGIGVAGVSRYYYSESSASNYHMQDIRFVPSPTFSGQALVTYYGYYKTSAGQGSYAGRIYISVGKQEPGISYSTDGEAARFSAEDFAAYSLAVTGRTFRYISFTLPSSAYGALYYNYLSESIYDSPVTSGARYYRSTTPSVSNVYFVPKSGYSGSFLLAFSGVDISGAALSGNVTITVTAYGAGHTPAEADGPFVYTVQAGRSVSLGPETAGQRDKFEDQCQTRYGTSLYHIRFTSLPPSESGVLYDDGISSGNKHYVSVNTPYYYPKDIRFAAASGYSGVVSIPVIVTAYGSNNTFDGMVRFVVTESAGGSPLHYTVEPESRVQFIASDFADACYAATGYDISRVHFDSLPSSTAGGLYLNNNTPVLSTTYSNYSKSDLSNISFYANAGFTGSITIPFTGYATNYSRNNGNLFSGSVTITSTVTIQEVKPIGGAASVITYYTTGPAAALSAADLRNAAVSALPGTPATVILDRPSEGAGRLCLDFVSLSRYTEFNPRQSYAIGDVSRISFLPAAGFSGTEQIHYTVYDAGGNSFMGAIRFVVTPPAYSRYFSDMGDYAWAVPAVDFFRYYGAVNGNSRTGFGPAAEMRRGDFILLLSRAFAFPSASTVSYSDVPEDKYYAAAIASAKSLGIVTNSGSFNPEASITRQDAALYLYRALRQTQAVTPGAAADLAQFPDALNTASYAVEAMGALVRRGVFTGDYGRLRPDKALSRAETITILYRALA